MADTPKSEIPQVSPAGAGAAGNAAVQRSGGWQVSEEQRQEDELFNERADAVDAYERRRYGWGLFAVLMLILAGGFQIINGLVALFRSGTYLVGRSGLAVDVDYTTWGWVHIGLGLLAIVAALGLMRSHLWARILGVTLAVISAIAYMAFVPAFPALSLVVIALDVLIVYAITVHGSELKDAAD
jgi:hypothetical protein